MKIEQPLHNNVIIKQDSVEEQSYGNIIVADLGQEKPKTGIVIAIGPGTYNIQGTLIPMQAKVGDRVCFPSFGGIKFMADGEEYICVKDADIISTIKK